MTARNWQEALGDPHRIADWTAYFDRETAERPWRDVLVEWWPRLLPGIAAGATHAVIRVGHSVRTLLAGEETAPRVRELAHALGYWAARHQPLSVPALLGPAPSAAEALDRSAAGARAERRYPGPVRAADRLPGLAGPGGRLRRGGAVRAPRAGPGLDAPVRDPRARRADHAGPRGDRAQRGPAHPARPARRAVGAESAGLLGGERGGHRRLRAREAAPAPASGTGAADAGELFARAAAHGDDHTIKFTDTALDVGDALAFSAARRAIELNPPVF